MIVHDLRCVVCGDVRRSVVVEFGRYGTCGCGGNLAVTWEGGKPPGTDLLPDMQRFNMGLGCEVSTTREAERIARERGWEPCGDRVHGGEYMPEPKERPRLKPKHERRSRHAPEAKFENTAA